MVIFKTGIFKFSFPILGNTNIDNIEIIMIVGNEYELNKDRLISVIIYADSSSSISAANRIEEITTGVRQTVISKIFNENIHLKEHICSTDIIWYLYYEKMDLDSSQILNKISLTWDTETKQYHTPKWYIEMSKLERALVLGYA